MLHRKNNLLQSYHFPSHLTINAPDKEKKNLPKSLQAPPSSQKFQTKWKLFPLTAVIRGVTFSRWEPRHRKGGSQGEGALQLDIWTAQFQHQKSTVREKPLLGRPRRPPRKNGRQREPVARKPDREAPTSNARSLCIGTCNASMDANRDSGSGAIFPRVPYSSSSLLRQLANAAQKLSSSINSRIS